MANFVALACNAGEDVTITDTLAGSGSIAGWSFTFALLTNLADAVALVTKTVEAGITITDAPGRVLTVTLSAADTTRAAGLYWWTLNRSDAGAHAAYSYGPFTISSAVAR